MIRNTFHILVFVALLAGMAWIAAPVPSAHACPAGSVIYVDVDAVGANDGTSWADAITALQDALAQVSTCANVNQIWVAEGVYYPDVGAAQLADDPVQTFQLLDGVALYGGFVGTESALEQRDWTVHVTVLSGDIDGDDTNADGNFIAETTPNIQGDNSYHVVTGSGTDATAVLDGFTVTAGQADGDWELGYDDGGGMVNDSGSPTLTNVSFSGNWADWYGGGMFNDSSSPLLTDITFSGNGAGWHGGGMYIDGHSPVLTNVSFSGNWAARDGGGMYNDGVRPVLTNVSFSGNNAGDDGGGMHNSFSDPTLSNVTFSGNRANGHGGGMYNCWSSSPTIQNSIFWNNQDQSGIGTASASIYNLYDIELPSYEILSYSLVQGYGGSGEVWDYIDADPLFLLPVDPATAPTSVGDLRLQAYSPAINAGDNDADLDGTGTDTISDVAADLAGAPRIQNDIVDLGAYETAVVCPTATVIHVDLDATGANDGTDWGDAFTVLQDALFVARVCTAVEQVWVAEGVYYPDEGGGKTDNDRSATFQLLDGVAVYGGFEGTESALEQRDWTIHLTVLSGDIDGDNSRHVVTGSWKDDTAVLDGFRITAGQADVGSYNRYGGGMYNDSGSPTLNNLSFSGNSATLGGGAMYNREADPKLTNVSFSGNSSSGDGGGMYNRGARPKLTNVSFSGNHAGDDGGGIFNSGSDPRLTNVSISGNRADGDGGAMYNRWDSIVTIQNSIFWNNQDQSGTSTASASIYYLFDIETPSRAYIRYSLVQGSGGSGAGWDTSIGVDDGNNIDDDPTFVTSVFPATAPTTAGDLRLQFGSPAVNGGDNDADLDGTGPGTKTISDIATDLAGAPRIQNDIVDMGTYETTVVCPGGNVVYVDVDAAGANDGTSWTDAFTALQDAPFVARVCASVDQVWVAEGVYYPDMGAAQTDNDRFATFQLLDGMALYGGFTGAESALESRDWTTHITVLSGDIHGDDSNNDGNFIAETTAGVVGDNSYHVVTGSGTGATALLEGFTITAGSADGGVSGYYDHGQYGGGMFNDGGNPELTNVTFSGNSARLDGGGMHNTGSNPLLTDVTFSGNWAGMYGGGMSNANGSNPLLTNVTFSGNSASGDGGGMYNDGSDPRLTNATFSGNQAVRDGGGMYNRWGSSATIQNSIFWNNQDQSGTDTASASIYNDSSTATIRYSLVQGSGGSGAGWDAGIGTDDGNNIDDDPQFITPIDLATAPTTDGDLRLQFGSPAIDAGDNNADPDPSNSPPDNMWDILIDLAGNSRIENDIVDMGAYETTVVCPGGNVVYVDVDAAGANDGTSWTDAFTALQDAPFVARVCASVDQVWVAEGVYYPDMGAAQTDNDRFATFQLLDGMALYGGFTGAESALESRDWTTHITVLSGDIHGDDSNSDGNFIAETTDDIQGDNSYHVVTGSGTDVTAVLDGFTITAGSADGGVSGYYDHRQYGGGMFNFPGSPTLASIRFSGNFAGLGGGVANGGSLSAFSDVFFNGNRAAYGAGMYNASSSPTVTGATFSDNHAVIYGGGMDNNNGSDSNPVLTDVLFTGNSAGPGGGGGGLSNHSGIVTLTNVIFSGNSSEAWGGGVFIYNSNSVLTNVQFSGNSAASDGGGMYISDEYSNPTLTNVTFSGNRAVRDGGGMYNFGSPTIQNSIFWNNQDQSGINTDRASIANEDIGGPPVIRYSLVQGSNGSDEEWDAALGPDRGNNIDADPLFLTPVDPATAPTTASDLRLQFGSPAIDMGDNFADLNGAGPGTATISDVLTDQAGAPRNQNGIVDMGAYETEPASRIIIAKETGPDGDPQLFDFTLKDGPANLDQAFQLSDGEQHDSGWIAPGTGYNAAETALDGWLSSASCDDGSPVDDINLAGGETVTCTFLNLKPSSITIVKASNPTAPLKAFDFSLAASSGPPGPITLSGSNDGATDRFIFENLAPDSYTVTELDPGNWTTSAIICDSGDWTADPNARTLSLNLGPDQEITCTFTNDHEPVAVGESYVATEDTLLQVAAPGVLANDEDLTTVAMTAALALGVSEGSLTFNTDGSFDYMPNSDYCGQDSFAYWAYDGLADSNDPATVLIEVQCVDDPPVVSVDIGLQTVQYSDFIVPVTISATDVDSAILTMTNDAPAALSAAGGCTSDGVVGTGCTWKLEGQVQVPAEIYDVIFTVSDGSSDVAASTQVVAEPEDVTVTFSANNPAAMQVAAPGGIGGQISLVLQLAETPSDSAPGSGDIGLVNVKVNLVPVGPGSPIEGLCVRSTVEDGVLLIICSFDNVPVNTYTVQVVVAGGYFSGGSEDVLVVYDPSLGYTTGGGWFHWPGTSDKTNFGYTMKYNKKNQRVKGSLLLIRHLDDGTGEIYRVKSNALDGLSLGESDDPVFGWASFSGKCTYKDKAWEEPEGNHKFLVYVEDWNEAGFGNDQVWVEIRDKDGAVITVMSMDRPATDNTENLGGGNIVVPHGSGGVSKK